MNIISYGREAQSYLEEYKKLAKLTKNLAYAEDAMSYVKQALPLGSCNKAKRFDDPLHIAITDMRDEWESVLKKSSFNTECKRYKKLAKVAKKHGIGNCAEMSAVAYSYLKDKNLIKVAMLYLQGGDHAFIVIGKDPASDERDPYSWGLEAVVLDCWTNQFYPAAQIFEHMANHITHDGKVLFDVKNHTIGFPREMPTYETIKWLYSTNANKKLDYAKFCVKNSDLNLPNNVKILCLKEYIKLKSKSKKSPSFYSITKNVFYPPNAE